MVEVICVVDDILCVLRGYRYFRDLENHRFAKPINLPCGHTLCQECLEKSMAMATLGCPICRYRLSTWKRKFKDVSACIDKERDERIARLFPRYYSQRKSGLEASLCGSEIEIFRNVAEPPQPPIHVATPGAIRSEFAEALSRVTDTKNAEKSIHEEANLALTRQMLLESDIETIDLISGDENVDPLESTRTEDAPRVPQTNKRQPLSSSHGCVPLSTQNQFNITRKKGTSAAFKSVSKPKAKGVQRMARELTEEDHVSSRRSKPKKKSTLSCLQNLRRGTFQQSRFRQTSLLGFSSRL
ncbi:hypothetical protein Aperf_G00000093470 [Anoplocephala perfoliata]